MQQVVVRQRREVSAFRDKMANQFVGVLNEAFFPGGVRMCEVYGGVQFSGDGLMVGELGAVVGGYGEDVIRERHQHLHHQACHGLGILAFGRPFFLLPHPGKHLGVAATVMATGISVAVYLHADD